MNPTGSVHVLHVDDEPDLADLSATFLEKENEQLNVETTTGVSQALELLDDHNFDCIVSDYDMPNQNGIEFLKIVRETNPDLPFILFTGKGSEAIASEAISEGVTDYLQKQTGTDQYALLANQILNGVQQFRAEQTAERTQRKLAELAENTTDILWMVSGDWEELLFVNSAYEDIWHQSITQLQEDPRNLLRNVHPDDYERVREAMNRLSDGQPIDVEYRLNPDTDSTRWIWMQGQPVTDDAGTVVRNVGFARDITDRKQRERQLHSVTERLKSVIEASPDPIVAFDTDGRVEVWNSAATDVFGHSKEEAIGESFLSLGVVPDSSQSEFENRLSQVFDGETFNGIKVERITKTGEKVTLSLSKAPIREPNGAISGAVTVKKDITKREEHEQDLRLFRKAVEASGHSVYFTNQGGTIQYVNPVFEEVTGFSAEEVIGLNPRILKSGEHDRDYYEDLWDTILSGEVWRREIVNKTKTGETYVVDQTIAPVENDAGQITHFVAVNVDITKKHRYEQQLERQNERLERFAEIVAHDLRNPITTAKGYLELLEQDVDTTQEYFDQINRALSRMDEIISDVLVMARSDSVVNSREWVDLTDAAEKAWMMAGSEQGSLTVDDDIGGVQGDESRVRQLLENLFRNAVDHVGSDVRVKIGPLSDGSGFYVEDDGPGISGRMTEEIFNTGYTNSPSGTGLGLATVKEIVDAHDWTIQVATSTVSGARFEIRDLNHDANLD